MTTRGRTTAAAIGLLMTGVVLPLGAQEYDRGVDARYDGVTARDELSARIWFDRGEEPVVRPGDRVGIYYRASRDAYVAIFNIDTNGTVRLVYPRSPSEDHYVRGGRDYRLLFPRSPNWYVDDPAGLGYYFVIASPEPFDFSGFDYSYYARGWDLTRVGRSVYRDPYVAMDDYVAELIPDWEYVPYALDFSSYHVGEERYDYPRFMCYDCHGFTPVSVWNPYHYACTSFRVVVYDDPYFYPAHRYRGSRVVFVRPLAHHLPRFSFKERADDEPPTPLIATRATAGSNAGPRDRSAIRRPADGRPGARPSPKEPGRASSSPPEIRRDRAGASGSRVRPSDLLRGRGDGGSAVRPPEARRRGEGSAGRSSPRREGPGAASPPVDVRGRPVLERRSGGEGKESVRPRTREGASPGRERASPGREGGSSGGSGASPGGGASGDPAGVRRPTTKTGTGAAGRPPARPTGPGVKARPPARGGEGGSGSGESFTPVVRSDPGPASGSTSSRGFRPLVGRSGSSSRASPSRSSRPSSAGPGSVNAGGSTTATPRGSAAGSRRVVAPRGSPGSAGTRPATAAGPSTGTRVRTGSPSALLRSRRGATGGGRPEATARGTRRTPPGATGATSRTRSSPRIIKRGGKPTRVAPRSSRPSTSSSRPRVRRRPGSSSRGSAVGSPRKPVVKKPAVRRGGGSSVGSGSRGGSRGGSKVRVKRRGGGGGGG